MITLLIDPVSKPRQTRADVWKKRPCVVKYREFADRLRFIRRTQHPSLDDIIMNGAAILFEIKMPKSWSRKKKEAMCGKIHHQTPDIDNLLKAFLDALLPKDESVGLMAEKKIWSERGAITVWPFKWEWLMPRDD